MAKELPFFKFEPGAWDNGNIQMCSRESKGLFADLCSLYWSRLGELPYALALQKLCNGNESALQELKKHEIIGVVDGQIHIEFLDEQLEEFSETSEKRRNAANKRWKDASALQLESKSNAIREEKRRGDKKIEEKKEDPLRALVHGWANEGLANAWFDWLQYKKESKKKLTLSTAKAQLKFLGGRPDLEAIAILNQSITSGWTGLFELKQNGKLGNNGKSNQRSSDAVIESGKDFGSFT